MKMIKMSIIFILTNATIFYSGQLSNTFAKYPFLRIFMYLKNCYLYILSLSEYCLGKLNAYENEEYTMSYCSNIDIQKNIFQF